MKLDTLLSQANEKHQVTTRSGAKQMDWSNAEQRRAERNKAHIWQYSPQVRFRSRSWGRGRRIWRSSSTIQQRTWPTSRPKRKYELDGI